MATKKSKGSTRGSKKSSGKKSAYRGSKKGRKKKSIGRKPGYGMPHPGSANSIRPGEPIDIPPAISGDEGMEGW